MDNNNKYVSHANFIITRSYQIMELQKGDFALHSTAKVGFSHVFYSIST